MIVMKILLWILLAVLGIIILILCLPVQGAVSYIDGKLGYSARYAHILLYNSEKKGLIPLVLNIVKKFKSRKKAKKKDEDTVEIPEMSDEPYEDEITEPPADNIETGEDTPQVDTSPEKDEYPPPDDWDDSSEPLSDEENEKKKKKKKKKDKPPKTLNEKIDFVLDIVRAADRPVLRLFKGIKIYELYIDFIIANEDAYKCALNYGRISGALYNVLAWVSALFNVRLRTIDVNPGFAVSKPRWDAAAKIKFRPITAVFAGVGLLLTYLFRFLIPGILQDRKLRKQAARQK